MEKISVGSGHGDSLSDVCRLESTSPVDKQDHGVFGIEEQMDGEYEAGKSNIYVCIYIPYSRDHSQGLTPEFVTTCDRSGPCEASTARVMAQDCDWW